MLVPSISTSHCALCPYPFFENTSIPYYLPYSHPNHSAGTLHVSFPSSLSPALLHIAFSLLTPSQTPSLQSHQTACCIPSPHHLPSSREELPPAHLPIFPPPASTQHAPLFTSFPIPPHLARPSHCHGYHVLFSSPFASLPCESV
jgi:hypothetical protein